MITMMTQYTHRSLKCRYMFWSFRDKKVLKFHSRVFMNEHVRIIEFKRFEKVISGHFHKKSDDGHIYYLGTQYEIMWSDYNKDFHIFDTETRELERIENPLKIFKKFMYDDTKY